MPYSIGGEDITNSPSVGVTMVGGTINNHHLMTETSHQHHQHHHYLGITNTSFQSLTAGEKPILDNCNRYEISLMNIFPTLGRAELVFDQPELDNLPYDVKC